MLTGCTLYLCRLNILIILCNYGLAGRGSRSIARGLSLIPANIPSPQQSADMTLVYASTMAKALTPRFDRLSSDSVTQPAISTSSSFSPFKKGCSRSCA